MKLFELRLQNFGSFKEKQVFVFPEGPGLYFMRGVNEVEGRLEGNGAGKSTVWKALEWLLYGRTSNGLRAGDIANWEVGKGVLVELDFELDDSGLLTMTRTWSPNSWTLYDHLLDETQDLAKGDGDFTLKWLRLEAAAFTQSIVMPQGAELFLDLKPDPQAALFSSVMNLDLWLKASDKAGAAAREQDMVCRRLEQQLALLEGQLKGADADDLLDSLKAWEKKQDKLIDDLEAHVDSLVIQLEERRALADRLELTLANTKRVYSDLTAAAEKHAGTCKSCGQTLPAPPGSAKKLRDALADVDDADRRLSAVKRDIQALTASIGRAEDSIDAAENEVNPFEKLLRERDARIQALREDAEATRSRLDAAQWRFQLQGWWVRWFKEIRLVQIAESLDQLEIEANTALVELGLPDWRLNFDVDKESKTGSLKRGFTVSVTAPHSKGKAAWASWSGGESQRLRCAAQAGLADLIRSRTGTPMPIEVWDEPTQWLSPRGVQDLLEFLRERAEREQRQVWVVDHRTLGYGGFKGTATVRKDTAGSYFDLSWVKSV